MRCERERRERDSERRWLRQDQRGRERRTIPFCPTPEFDDETATRVERRERSRTPPAPRGDEGTVDFQREIADLLVRSASDHPFHTLWTLAFAAQRRPRARRRARPRGPTGPLTASPPPTTTRWMPLGLLPLPLPPLLLLL